ncbi:alpha/beta hydrolase [Dongia soli]|uniref:Alpha/beta hydrolase fold domain-containing protein n=1 Tax=Dongia soli TaxID=600628 RepID=A0ABU5EEW1_9PROT|nr:alpha/beta hydrolase fold domain-containing protein [Dongia soli]MDY0884753.1 alpha/beta hydrolase fold domain-containing protein [Dongia soli]
MTASWAHSDPNLLRAHHARDAIIQAGPLPPDVAETALQPQGAFQGGLLFTPSGGVRAAVIVYFHGGGFLAGSPESHRCVTAWLAKMSGLRVLSARYRLAPEHHFPAQRDDAIAACELAATLPGAGDLVLAGDSAGACVALWGLRGLPADHRRRVQGLVLLYGGYGLTDSASIARYGTAENGLDAETLAIMYRRLGDPAQTGLVFPPAFAAEITEPAYVLAASLDAVFDDSAMLFRALPTNPANRFVTVEGQDHGFFKATGKSQVAMQELQKATDWLGGLMRE